MECLYQLYLQSFGNKTEEGQTNCKVQRIDKSAGKCCHWDEAQPRHHELTAVVRSSQQEQAAFQPAPWTRLSGLGKAGGGMMVEGVFHMVWRGKGGVESE